MHRAARHDRFVAHHGQLYCGDNLEVLRQHVADASVDVVYLDPPFNSNRLYHLQVRAAEPAPAFDDCWAWNTVADLALERLTRAAVPTKLSTLMQAMYAFLGPSNMLAYLAMMAERLLELQRVLRPSGSIFLHCDATASHYLKLVLDAIFGPTCFKNEIIWRYRRWPTKAHRFQRMHDVILYYAAQPGNEHTFHTLYGYEKLAESTLKTFGTRKQRADFSSGHRKPSVVEEETKGPPMSDVWDVGIIAPISRERTGYPTQKPLALLERVILSSSNEGDVVLDPFCGGGTTLEAAERHGRRWIGIDVSPIAIGIVEDRLGRLASCVGTGRKKRRVAAR